VIILVRLACSRAGVYNSFDGHCVAFPDLAAYVCTTALPDAAFASRGFFVCVQGPRNVNFARLEGRLRTHRSLHCNTASVTTWLNAARFLNPTYRDVAVRSEADADRELESFRTTILNRRLDLPTSSRAAVSAAIARSDVSRPESDAESSRASASDLASVAESALDPTAAVDDDVDMAPQLTAHSVLSSSLDDCGRGIDAIQCDPVIISAVHQLFREGFSPSHLREHSAFVQHYAETVAAIFSAAQISTRTLLDLYETITGRPFTGRPFEDDEQVTLLEAVKFCLLKLVRNEVESKSAPFAFNDAMLQPWSVILRSVLDLKIADDAAASPPEDPSDSTEPHGNANPNFTTLAVRFESETVISSTRRVLQSVRVAISGHSDTGDVDHASAAGSNSTPSPDSSAVPTLAPTDDIPRVVLPRSEIAYNDYEQRNEIVYGGFLPEFPLGQGLGPGDGPLDTRARRFLLTHFSRRPARNDRLMHTLHNTKMRADTGRVVAAAIRTDTNPMRKFFELVHSHGFDARLDSAIANPDTADAIALAKELAPVIMLTGSRVPFSALERGTRAVTELVSMVRFFGLPNVFFTVGPDETRNVIIARVAFRRDVPCLGSTRSTNCPAASSGAFWSPESSQPDTPFAGIAGALDADFDEHVIEWRVNVGREISQDPTAIALVCQRMMEALREELFGVPRLGKCTTAQFSSRPPGALGRAQACFDVTEVTGR
jgi:hypothetical protein